MVNKNCVSRETVNSINTCYAICIGRGICEIVRGITKYRLIISQDITMCNRELRLKKAELQLYALNSAFFFGGIFPC